MLQRATEVNHLAFPMSWPVLNLNPANWTRKTQLGAGLLAGGLVGLYLGLLFSIDPVLLALCDLSFMYGLVLLAYPSLRPPKRVFIPILIGVGLFLVRWPLIGIGWQIFGVINFLGNLTGSKVEQFQRPTVIFVGGVAFTTILSKWFCPEAASEHFSVCSIHHVTTVALTLLYMVFLVVSFWKDIVRGLKALWAHGIESGRFL